MKKGAWKALDQLHVIHQIIKIERNNIRGLRTRQRAPMWPLATADSENLGRPLT